MSELRIKVRGIILAITGLILALLFIRFFFDLFGASDTNFFANLINSTTNVLIEPFKGFNIGNSSDINNDVVVAALAYIFLGIAISEIVTAFLYEDLLDIIQNLIDGVYKFIELLIFLRIIFKILGFNNISGFGELVFDMTDWTQFLGVNIPILPDVIDWNAIFILIFIVILDLATEGFISSLVRKISIKQKKFVNKTPAPQQNVYIQQPTAQPPQPVKVVQQPQPQNITINVPIPPSPPVSK